MQNVLPRSGARAYTVSDEASADQRYCDRNCVKDFAVLSDTGTLFHRIGDATVKHLSPCVTVLDVGTNNSSVDEPEVFQ